jgi:hypothetical protein
MRSQEHQKTSGKCHQEKHQVPVKRRTTQLRKGDDKELTEDAVVLPEYIQPWQSEKSLCHILAILAKC